MSSAKNNAIRKRLEQLRRPDTGELVVADVVRAAQNKNDILHEHFDWDVKRAAWKHWCEQARRLIRSVRYVEVIEQASEPKRVKVKHDTRAPQWVSPCRNGSYEPLADVAKDREKSMQLIKKECDYAVSALQRALVVASEVGLTHQIKAAIKAVMSIR